MNVMTERYNSHSPSPARGCMRPLLTNALADLLTRYPREAGANLLNLINPGNNLQSLPEDCSLIRGNAHNEFMISRAPEISQFPIPQFIPSADTSLSTPRFRPMHLKAMTLRRYWPKTLIETNNLRPCHVSESPTLHPKCTSF